MGVVTKKGRLKRRSRYKMREWKYILAAAFSAMVIILVIIALIAENSLPGVDITIEKEKDPHEGQVYLYDGFDWVWMTPLEGVPANEFTENDFGVVNGKITYLGDKYTVLRGIDVSEHQKNIDWKQVADSGIDYAYIRVGRRGYTQGGLFDDEYFEQNINAAEANGLKIGVYMFSQAISVEEAIEEANYLLEKVREHEIFMPVVYDWEKIEEADSRTDSVSTETRTACAVAFCDTIRNAGYPVCVYFNRNLGYYGYDLTQLNDYEFWFSLPESPFPNFYYGINMWQYSFTEAIPGIEIETDANLWFIPNVVEEDSVVA